MSSLSQLQIRQQQVLAYVRGVEAMFGLDCIAQLYRAKQALRSTPRKAHKITDRGQRKRAARKLAVEAILAGRTVISAKV